MGRSDRASIRCAWCAMPIEHADGRLGEWMHSLTRREHCADGQNVGEPETPGQMKVRLNLRRTEWNTRRRTG